MHVGEHTTVFANHVIESFDLILIIKKLLLARTRREAAAAAMLQVHPVAHRRVTRNVSWAARVKLRMRPRSNRANHELFCCSRCGF